MIMLLVSKNVKCVPIFFLSLCAFNCAFLWLICDCKCCFLLSVVEYSCLGDWFVGKNHYFAVANTKESRKDEKYRCFLKNRDDDLFIGVSITAECNTLRTVEKSPERLHITPGEFGNFCGFNNLKKNYFENLEVLSKTCCS